MSRHNWTEDIIKRLADIPGDVDYLSVELNYPDGFNTINYGYKKKDEVKNGK